MSDKLLKVAVIGSSTCDDKKLVYDFLTRNRAKIEMIVSGKMKGADAIGVEWASDYNVPYITFPAASHNPDTGERDRGAIYRRNRRMLGFADYIVAFMQKGGTGGTQFMIGMAEEMNKLIKIIEFEPKAVESEKVDFKAPLAKAPEVKPQMGIPAPVIPWVHTDGKLSEENPQLDEDVPF